MTEKSVKKGGGKEMIYYHKIEPPENVKDWENHLVISTKIIGNQLGEMPAGTTFVITTSGITKHLQTLPCIHCGLIFKVTSKKTKENFLLDFYFIEAEDKK
jgi:hypothetical protein